MGDITEQITEVFIRRFPPFLLNGQNHGRRDFVHRFVIRQSNEQQLCRLNKDLIINKIIKLHRPLLWLSSFQQELYFSDDLHIDIWTDILR